MPTFKNARKANLNLSFFPFSFSAWRLIVYCFCAYPMYRRNHKTSRELKLSWTNLHNSRRSPAFREIHRISRFSGPCVSSRLHEAATLDHKPYIMKPFHTFKQQKSQLRYLGFQSPPSTFKHSNALGFLELPLLTKQLSVNFPSHFGGNETRFFAIPLQFSLSRSQRTQLTHTSPTFPPLVYGRLLTSHIYICAGCAYHPNL